MPTYASDVKPASTGLRLGNENQKWDAYIQDIFVDSIVSGAANAASTGFMRLASTDGIAWRNAANTADVTLSKTTSASSTTPADVLMFGGAGIEGPFLSHQLNPSATGEVRLSSTDVIAFRNTANTADVNALSHNVNDSINLGGSGGVLIPGNATVSGSLNLQGSFNVAKLNNIVFIDGTTYPYTATGLTSAIAVVMGLGGGTVDARGFGAVSVPISSTIAIGDTTGIPITVLFDPATLWVPSTSSTNMFTVFAGAKIDGLTAKPSGVAGYSGTALAVVGPLDGAKHPTSISRVFIDGTGLGTGQAFVLSTTSAANAIQFVEIRNVRIKAMQYGLRLAASGSGWVNACFFFDIVVSDSINGFSLEGLGGAVQANTFHSCQAENGAVHSMAAPFALSTSGGAQCFDNQFYGMAVWDFVGGFTGLNIGASCNGNYFSGDISGDIVDNGTDSTIFNSFANQTGLGGDGYGWRLGSNKGVIAKRYSGHASTALATTDFVASAGWGTSPVLTMIVGTDCAASMTIQAKATVGASPTLTLTFKDGTWTRPPVVLAHRTDIVASTGAPSASVTNLFHVTSVTATTCVFTFLGTPVANSTYGLAFIAMGT